MPKIASPIHDPSVWHKSIDCLFLDAEEATKDQLSFIARAKGIINAALESNQKQHIQIDDGTTNTIDATKNIKTIKKDKDNDEISISEISIDEYGINQLEEDDFIFKIPKKFRHVRMDVLLKSSTAVEELKEVIKNIHPWSSLHFGLTALDSLIRLYTQTIKNNLGKNIEVQVLSPQVRGTLGTANLNQCLQQAINPYHESKPQIKIGERCFRVNDRVIQTRNNYDLNVFNGDIGYIQSIDPETFDLEISFNGQNKVVVYRREDLTELQHAYAITIHKSQGSEFDAVIIPVTTQHYKMLFRNLIYTGLTRAKKMMVFVGSRKALSMAIKSVDARKRQTTLSERFP